MTEILVIVANDAGKFDYTQLPPEIRDKCVELVCHEKFENQKLSSVVADIIDDNVDIWLDKLNDE